MVDFAGAFGAEAADDTQEIGIHKALLQQDKIAAYLRPDTFPADVGAEGIMDGLSPSREMPTPK
ncbi:hypothetical protein [uncultured Oscillibacter sp.]|uniref:hypothetical protein n=1 Tax=uncultured Oscillibacter sp. TaxID=876091 RepID=UPI0025F738BD|nr:hypothetical protein [uncultured Oscillibacter sp.]